MLLLLKIIMLGCSSEKTEFVGKIEVSFPQAVNGGLWANPDLFSEIPLRLNTATGKMIEVIIDGETYQATENIETEYLSLLPLGHGSNIPESKSCLLSCG